jgi:hypothetical protein
LKHVVDVVFVVDQSSAVPGQRVAVAPEQLLETAVGDWRTGRVSERDEHTPTLLLARMKNR